jgi:hypothetical protein
MKVTKRDQCQFCKSAATHEAKARRCTLKLCKPCVNEHLAELLTVREMPKPICPR